MAAGVAAGVAAGATAGADSTEAALLRHLSTRHGLGRFGRPTKEHGSQQERGCTTCDHSRGVAPETDTLFKIFDLLLEDRTLAAKSPGFLSKSADLSPLSRCHTGPMLFCVLHLTAQLTLNLFAQPPRQTCALGRCCIELGQRFLPLATLGEDLAEQERRFGVGWVEDEKHAKPLGRGREATFLRQAQASS